MPILLETIKRRFDFLRMSKKSEKKFTKGFVLQKTKRDHSKSKLLNKNVIRIGLTITKKLGSAVTRNKIKRRLRHLSNEVLTNMGKKNYDYVIIANRKALEMNYKELKEDLIKAIK